MTGKNKKELQAENVKLKEELADITAKYDNLKVAQESHQRKCQLDNDNDKKKPNLNCTRCDATFESLKKLKEHKGNEHKSEKEFFKCDMCEYEFDEEWKRSAHSKMHKYKCEQCDKCFKYLEIKRKHVAISHENGKFYCHYFNNKLTCPYSEECIFLHEDSTLCKYGSLCERNLCMFKHESVHEVTEKESDDSDKRSQTNLVDVHDEETVDIGNAMIENEMSVVEEMIQTIELSEPIEQDNLNLAFLDSNPLCFKCKMCDFAFARKSELRNHKKRIHNWCFICFSSFLCQENLKDHFIQLHSENEADLDLVVGKAP